jgi:hypothetical protein
VIGPMTGVGRTGGCDLPETVGVFFRPGRATPLVDLPIAELTTGRSPLPISGGQVVRGWVE